jgi:hypothetical protein
MDLVDSLARVGVPIGSPNGTHPRYGLFALAGNIIGITNSGAFGIAVK